MNKTVEQIKELLTSTNTGNTFSRAWSEGYVCALHTEDIITPDEFSELIEWIRTRKIVKRRRYGK